ncbi:MAG: metallophosphoesterase [Clostridiales bacterium]|nr:metallophosphoesterase [Clostridiales bacterium]
MKIKKFFAGVISVILSATILLSLPVSGASPKSSDMGLFVTADIHTDGVVTDISNSRRIDDELYFHTTIQGQMDAESVAIIKSMLKSFAESDKQIMLIAGDLSDGKRVSHDILKNLLTETEKNTGKRILVINGNHDIAEQSSETRIDYKEFKDIYNDFGYSEALERDENSCSYTAELSGDYRLIAIDSGIYGKDEGRIYAERYAWIKEQIETAKKDGKHIVAMMHHSLLPHFTAQAPMITVDGGDYMSFASYLADNGVKYVFTGHIHANDISSAKSKAGNTVYDVQTGSLITSPNGYREVVFDSDGVKISTKYVTKIDINDLPAGYNQAQLELISTDFPTYSRNFFELGMKLWLERFIGSAHRVSRLLKIEEGTPEYEKLDSIMAVLGDALELPLYEKDAGPGKLNSVEEIAAAAGCALPESDYKYAYQLVAEIMGGFFRGDENITTDDVEVKLLYAVVRSGVAYAFGKWANSSEFITKSTAKIIYKSHTVNTVVEAILSPIVGGMAGDAYSPADLNVTLEPYGENAAPENPAPLSMIKLILNFVKTMTEYFFAHIKK